MKASLVLEPSETRILALPLTVGFGVSENETRMINTENDQFILHYLWREVKLQVEPGLDRGDVICEIARRLFPGIRWSFTYYATRYHMRELVSEEPPHILCVSSYWHHNHWWGP